MSLNENSRGLSKRDLALNRALLFLLFAGIAILVSLADRAPMDLESVFPDLNISQKFVYYWQGVIYRFFPGPYLYRILIPYSYWGINQITHLNLITIDLFPKVILLIACQYSLLRYLGNFFEKTAALLGVFLFDSLLGYFLSFIKGPSIIETIDILNFLIVTLGLIALYRNNYLYLSALLFIGLLNRETPLILLPIAFIHERIQYKKFHSSSRVLLISLIAFLSPRIFLTSWADATWFNTGELHANLSFLFGEYSREAVMGNIRLAVLLGPFLLLGLYKFSEQPRFLRVASIAIPLLIVVHYFTGRIVETRLWIPLFPLLMPLTVNNLLKMSGRSI